MQIYDYVTKNNSALQAEHDMSWKISCHFLPDDLFSLASLIGGREGEGIFKKRNFSARMQNTL